MTFTVYTVFTGLEKKHFTSTESVVVVTVMTDKRWTGKTQDEQQTRTKHRKISKKTIKHNKIRFKVERAMTAGTCQKKGSNVSYADIKGWHTLTAHKLHTHSVFSMRTFTPASAHIADHIPAGLWAALPAVCSVHPGCFSTGEWSLRPLLWKCPSASCHYVGFKVTFLLLVLSRSMLNFIFWPFEMNFKLLQSSIFP